MRIIDNILNKITMYRVVLYELIGLLVAAGVLGFFHRLPYGPVNILFSVMYIFAVSWIFNKIFAWAFRAPSNPESTYITALILSLVITPALSLTDFNFLLFAFWASGLAIASKYILAIGKKHVFNPAAIAIVITAFVLGQSASWWTGTAVMLPFVLFGGFLVTRKIQRFDLVLSAIASSLLFILGGYILRGGNNVPVFAWDTLISTPLIFFTTVMLTEPLTMPPARASRILYGILTSILFSPAVHIGHVYSTPELALAVGNIFSYAVSPKKKLLLTLKEVKKISADSYDFIFTPDKRMNYRPGQYMEWTLEHEKPDSRGIRRYFTLASSPTEDEIRMGVKFYNKGSSFKRKLLEMEEGEGIIASGLAGDFVLPKDQNEKLVFMAGGIGITPFRSHVRYLMDKKEPREITLLYTNKNTDDISYKEVLDSAEKEIGMKTVYALTSPNISIPDLPNFVRRIDEQVIKAQVSDYMDRIFYLSGPRGMVVSFEETLRSLGIPKSRIKTDFFPGFA